MIIILISLISFSFAFTPYSRSIRSQSFISDSFGTKSIYNVQLKIFPNHEAYIEIVKYPLLADEFSIEIDCDNSVRMTFSNWTQYAFNGVTVFREFIGTFSKKNTLKCLVKINSISHTLKSCITSAPISSMIRNSISGDFHVNTLSLTAENSIVEWIEDELVTNSVYDGLLQSAKRMVPFPNDLLHELDELLIGKNVFISLTTSPNRLLMLHYELASLDLSRISKIFITIPSLFRNKERYRIPKKLIEEFPKIQFLIASFDLGPSLKIIGAIDHLRGAGGNLDDILIIIDDDNAYGTSLINSLIYFSLKVPEGAIATSTYNGRLEYFGLPPVKRSTFSHLKSTNYVEGYSGYACRVRHFDTEIIKKMVRSDINPSLSLCYQSDDILISHLFLYYNVPIYTTNLLKTKFYTQSQRMSLPHYTDSTALHKHSCYFPQTYSDVNYFKYSIVVDMLANLFIDFNNKFIFLSKDEVIERLNESLS